jgi:itaconate CoA-transferase
VPPLTVANNMAADRHHRLTGTGEAVTLGCWPTSVTAITPGFTAALMSKPLAGLLVVALEQAVAAPMCSRRLADAGARVIKLERPEGDFARGYDKVVHGESAYFVWLNRGKESVFIDLAKAADVDLLEALIAKADVFIQNLKPGAVAKLGFGIDRLRRDYPRLICCSISGYGEVGPYAKRKAYDLLIQAESGLASITGGPESPARVGVSVVDIATGMNAYEGILEAIIARSISGAGADIRVSLFDSMAEWMAVPLLHGIHGVPPKRVGFSHPVVAPYGVFDTKDGTPILISIQNDREWAVFAREILKRPDLATDPKMATNVARMANRPEMDGMIATTFAARSIADLMADLDRADIAFGRVNDVLALRDHPHLRSVTVDTPTGPASLPAPPAYQPGVVLAFGAVPALGVDTARVRSEFLTI